MPRCLTPAQIEQYREEGCVFPIRIMSETEAAELRGRLEAFERRTGGPLTGDMRHKSHLLFAWLAELVRRGPILDTVEDLHGPDLLCWDHQLLHQGGGRSGLCVVAPGLDQLGPE
jgi:non-haem Fe2+, alpha-ketoglutarate-dependent halogenase